MPKSFGDSNAICPKCKAVELVRFPDGEIKERVIDFEGWYRNRNCNHDGILLGRRRTVSRTASL